MNQSPLQITLEVIAETPPNETLLKEVREKAAVLVASKLRKLGKVPESYVVRTATLKKASSQIEFRYPLRNIWQFDIVFPPEIALRALISFNSYGPHFFEYPLTDEEKKDVQSLF